MFALIPHHWKFFFWFLLELFTLLLFFCTKRVGGKVSGQNKQNLVYIILNSNAVKHLSKYDFSLLNIQILWYICWINSTCGITSYINNLFTKLQKRSSWTWKIYFSWLSILSFQMIISIEIGFLKPAAFVQNATKMNALIWKVFLIMITLFKFNKYPHIRFG